MIIKLWQQKKSLSQISEAVYKSISSGSENKAKNGKSKKRLVSYTQN